MKGPENIQRQNPSQGLCMSVRVKEGIESKWSREFGLNELDV
jgi:hypothetical protein